jgi:hypothetical protein
LATGTYKIVFKVPMNDISYSATYTSDALQSSEQPSSRSAKSFVILNYNGANALANTTHANVQVFGGKSI